MWADREDMQNSAAWVRQEREKWQRWRGELTGSDALTELLAEHADEVSQENTGSVITIAEDVSAEREAWFRFAAEQFQAAYGENEPEYTLDMIREPNPKYKP